MSTTDIKDNLIVCAESGDYYNEDVMIETIDGEHVHEDRVGS